MVIRIVVADDQPLARAGIRAIVESESDLRVVAEAADGGQAATRARDLQADVVLMDIQMPGIDGVEGVRRTVAARPAAKVIVLTMFDLDDHVFGALQAGASGFLLKSTPPQELIQAVRSVQEGALLFAPSVTRRLVETFVRRTPPARGRPEVLDGLTDRELEVFRGLAEGLSNAEIADRLFVAPTTVKSHVARILAKLRLRDRAQAVVLAYECGFLTPGD